MDKRQPLTNLTQLFDQIEGVANDQDSVSLEAMMGVLGRRSFGPLLLLAGLITLAPIVGDIPGVPTMIGIFVLLVAGQLVVGRQQLWLPQWLLQRSISARKVKKTLGWSRRPARFVDRLLKPRLSLFAEGGVFYVIAVLCMIIAAAMPAMEVIPFSANVAGAALTAFGLALIARDGLVSLLATLLTLATGGLALYQLL